MGRQKGGGPLRDGSYGTQTTDRGLMVSQQKRYHEQPGSRGCSACGRSVDVDEGGLCIECSSRFSPNDPLFMDSLIVMTILALLVIFSISAEGNDVSRFPGEELSSLRHLADLLMVLVLAPLIVISLVKGTNLFSIENVKGVICLIIPVLMVTPMVPILGSRGDLEGAAPFFAMLMVSMGLSAFAMRKVLTFKASDLAFYFFGVFLFDLGLSNSVDIIELPPGPWFLDGPSIMAFGMVVSFFMAYRTMRSMDLCSIGTAPVLLFIVATSTVLVVLLVGHILETSSRHFNYFMLSSIFVLGISLSAMVAKRTVGFIMTRTEREMDRFARKGDEHIRKGRFFYGLQQLDLAIKRNPMDGFGKARGANNPLFVIEGPKFTEGLSFSASSYELALNEKGLAYSYQGRFPDAMRIFLEATRREPKYLDPYWNLSTLMSTSPGKRQEGNKYSDFLVASKASYLRKWLRKGMQRDHAEWMLNCHGTYVRTMEQRADLLNRLSSEGDVWAYYRLVG